MTPTLSSEGWTASYRPDNVDTRNRPEKSSHYLVTVYKNSSFFPLKDRQNPSIVQSSNEPLYCLDKVYITPRLVFFIAENNYVLKNTGNKTCFLLN